ncbi:hypothetical protein KGF56_003373 [Candida oxycetoniae]|uniref:Transcription factor CBF/NF-Y/archaeal histone domain-containing protein n=1 Tax=Candida oxycetoniae TaxID=497107 RepID=A0AAI9SVG8_9ASCO|nr:uncharacterized protein KGF56_003373 [Candida oxycetoniae]KAI3403813.1 hypothetical protein KGF56_003373 [Candida oxycetoniae]
MKRALPPQAKVSKESKECMQECVSEFISFITSQASDRCMRENRKTLNGEDILWSMYTLGFENYAETLKIYLAKYRQLNDEIEQLLFQEPSQLTSEDIQEQFTQVYNEGSYFGEDLELSQNQANEKLQNTKTLSSLN